MKLKKEQIIKVSITAVCIILFAVLVAFANSNNPQNNKSDGKSSIVYNRAEVVEIIKDNTQKNDKAEQLLTGSQDIKIEIKSGKHKGEQSQITNYVSALNNVPVNKGTNIIVRTDTKSNGSYTFTVYNYDRITYLVFIVILFFALLAIIGGRKGIKAMAGLLFTLFCVLFLLLPLLAKGYAAIPTAIFIIIITTIVCMVLLDGINSKTISASIGTILGVMIAGLLAYISGCAVNVTGYNMNEAESLMLIGSNTNLKIKGLLVAGIFISSLGAVMDVAMSIASSIYELNSVNKNMSSKQLFRSGMNIGKDAMGTMANTLILAFTGSSLNLLLLIFSYGIPMMQLFNTDSIAIEIIQSVARSIGIILTVPLVAFISSIFVKKLKK